MAYVQCVHCGRSAVTARHASSPAHCVRCGAELPHPAGCATPIERRLRLVSQPSLGWRLTAPADAWRAAA